MAEPLHPPRKLEKSDRRSDFSSGAEELDDWFGKYAMQNQRANNAVTYVLVHQEVVLGYYAIASGGVARGAVPVSFAKNRPSTIPVILLARLAVDRQQQGRRLGKVLLRDAVERAVVLSGSLGAAALLIHARDEVARRFYQHNLDVLASPLDPLQLILPIAEAAKFVGG